MGSAIKKLSALFVFVSVYTLILSSSASAHVVVRPAEVVTAGFHTFTVGVPNEKNIPTTKIKLIIPDGLEHVSPTQKSGWKISLEKEGAGENATVKSITWSGSKIGVDLRDEFTFSAKTPEKTTELQWKAYQTYADGTVVSWDQEQVEGHGHGGDSGPFSVTQVVVDTEQAAAIKNVDQVAADAENAANTALYVGVAGIIVGLIGIFLATRKQ